MRQPEDSAHCVIACQGSAQLLAAMAAAGLRPSGGNGGRTFSVVVHDLHVPPGQCDEFVTLITQLTRVAPGCRAVRYVSPDQLTGLAALRDRRGYGAAARALAESLALAPADAIYLGQNPVLLNQLMRWGHRGATRVCYGDGVGVNFSSGYFAPAPAASPASHVPPSAHFARNVASRVRRGISRWFGDGARDDPGFDCYRLLMPNLFDERIDNYQATEPSVVRELFAACGALQLPAFGALCATVRDRTRSTNRVVIMLSTNFSEAGKMPRAGELEAYRRFLGPQVEGERPLLVIKPHPRDANDKIHELQAMLAADVEDCIVLDDPMSFYLPFEVVYALCFDDWSASRPPPTIACFSTAGLALEYLYGARCTVGFGDQLVRSHMFDQWHEHRLRHERDLRNAAAIVRANRERPADERSWPHH